jgi:N-acetyl-gamma-glutamyl-phosphate reductase
MIRVGIIGAAGYTGGELIRILLGHPEVSISTLESQSHAGCPVDQVHSDIIQTGLRFLEHMEEASCDVIFLCKGHGASKKIIASNPSILSKKLIDLSQDFRVKGDHDFVYGLPEINKNEIKRANHIANPGCFATAIQLSILPAINNNVVTGDFHVSGITGSTGAGASLQATSHFSWRSNNAGVYKALQHQHMIEINANISQGGGSKPDVHFIPYRGAFTRGIIVTAYFKSECSLEQMHKLYEEAYDGHPFTFLVDHSPAIKQVVNTNNALIHVTKADKMFVIVCVIDNLVKGASGQAIQNMNLMMGLGETKGLQLKASAF